MDKVKIGLVGASASGTGWGAAAHIPAIKAANGVELTAVCTTNKTSADASSKAYNVPFAYHSLEALLDNDEINLVSCVVNIPSHYKIVKEAILAGKNVYCEWPLGATLDETKELAYLSKKHKTTTIIGLQGRVCPEINYIKNLHSSGWFGEVISIKLTAQGKSSGVRKSKKDWEKELSKKATLFNIVGGHNLDYMQYCFGDITELFARISTRFKTISFADTNETADNPVSDYIHITGELSTSIPFSMEISAVPHHASGWILEVHGTKGSLRASTAVMPQISPIKLETAEGEDAFKQIVLPETFALKGPGKNVSLMYQTFASKTEELPNFESALKIHELLDVIQKSSAARKNVKVDLSPIN